MGEKSWMEELETALKEEHSEQWSSNETENIAEIARPNLWKNCLDIDESFSRLDSFDDIFDLPCQQQLRDDCRSFVVKLGNNEEDKISVLSDLESIMTCYCKSSCIQRQYRSDIGWLDLLVPLISLKLPRSQVYNLFESIQEKYVPKHSDSFHLLRLLLLYHDPQLCNVLDTKKVSTDLFAKTWDIALAFWGLYYCFQTLFASNCDIAVVISIWDSYFRKGDPFFIFFLSLVIIVNARELILNLQDSTKSELIESISSLPCNLSADDVTDFCALAQYYDLKTPSSFKQDLENIMFHDSNSIETKEGSVLSQALCLPVSVVELISNSEDNTYLDSEEESVRFFLIDCRPAEQYNSGHPSTAFHLDCNLMLQEPNSFSTAVQALLSCQRQALAANSEAAGEHLCFLGCGELLADQYTHMVVASFLQKHTPFVSLLSGGYEAIHEYLNDRVDNYLTDHNSQLCLVCQKNTIKNINGNNNKYTETNKNHENSEKSDILGKIGAVMKLKSAEVKEKLAEYISNPIVNNENDRHISSSDKVGKPYRNIAPVFSIDDDHDPDANSGEQLPSPVNSLVVRLSSYLANPRKIVSVKCQEITMSGYIYECYLMVTDSHLIALRPTDQKDSATITVNRPLKSIARITCKKRHPEFVTFQYGVLNNISDMDKFLIPSSAEVTGRISEQIRKITNS